MSIKNKFCRIIDLIFDIQLGISMLSLMVMMLDVVADVFMRFVFNSPIQGSFDIVGICLVIMVFFGMGRVISGGHEIVIDFIDEFVPSKVARILVSIAGFLTAGLLVFIIYSMISPAIEAYNYGDIKLELNFPVWIIWAFALIGIAGAVLASLKSILKPMI